MHFFLKEYGVLELKHVASLDEWEVFIGVDLDKQVRRMLIVTPKKWAVAPKERFIMFKVFKLCFAHATFYSEHSENVV